MKRQFEKIALWIEEDPNELEAQKSGETGRLESAIESGLSWMMSNVVPVLLIALIINLAIMFTVPVKITMAQWFWLKDPISLGLGYILFISFKRVYRHIKTKKRHIAH